MKFELDADQIAKYKAWVSEQNKIAIAKQKAEKHNPNIIYKECWEAGYPYYGAIGGADEFIFTPNSIGVAVEARNTYTGDKIDLTDYESW